MLHDCTLLLGVHVHACVVLDVDGPTGCSIVNIVTDKIWWLMLPINFAEVIQWIYSNCSTPDGEHFPIAHLHL